jgi:hypothetical protein
LSVDRESGAKGIVIRALRTPATGKGLAYFCQALRRVKDPGPGLPGRLVAQVLRMAAGQRDNPVSVCVLLKSCDRRVTGSTPSVRVLFAFGQILV